MAIFYHILSDSKFLNDAIDDIKYLNQSFIINSAKIYIHSNNEKIKNKISKMSPNVVFQGSKNLSNTINYILYMDSKVPKNEIMSIRSYMIDS